MRILIDINPCPTKHSENLVIEVLRQFESVLVTGALVVVDESRSRARVLPLT
jgi:predicted nuclease of predicted toxin-antitoxin system